MAWTLDDHLGFESTQTTTTPKPECPGCGHPDVHGDDFCHECGHSFAHLGSGTDLAYADDEVELPCPMCHSGALATLDHGRTQCDSCGYMVRDEGM